MGKFSDRLNEALIKTGITAAELSRKLDVDEGTISCYRKGKYAPKQRRTEAIANILDVNIAWLMGADVPMHKEKSPTDLTEGEKELLELVRSLPDDKQRLALEMIKAALSAT